MLEEITAACFDQALNTLPPVRWCRADAFDQKFNRIPETFMSPEMLDGTRTVQYAALDGRHFRKVVDLADRRTWITGAEIDGPEESRLSPDVRIERHLRERRRAGAGETVPAATRDLGRNGVSPVCGECGAPPGGEVPPMCRRHPAETYSGTCPWADWDAARAAEEAGL